MKDLDDITIYQESFEQLRVHIFVARLEDDFEQIQGEILHKELVTYLKNATILFNERHCTLQR